MEVPKWVYNTGFCQRQSFICWRKQIIALLRIAVDYSHAPGWPWPKEKSSHLKYVWAIFACHICRSTPRLLGNKGPPPQGERVHFNLDDLVFHMSICCFSVDRHTGAILNSMALPKGLKLYNWLMPNTWVTHTSARLMGVRSRVQTQTGSTNVV